MNDSVKRLVWILAVAAAFLVGINTGRKAATGSIENLEQTKQSDNTPQNIPTPTPAGNIPFTSSACTIAFEYPGYLQYVTLENSAAFVDVTRPDRYLKLDCAKDLPEPGSGSDSVSQIMVASASARLHREKRTSDGTLIASLYLTHPQTDLEIRINGTEDAVDTVLNTLEFK
ncbi:hypothetical protein A2Z33_00535 [Candidatus Gottesmanbacteria bacterium RBG_16_52_11]|uniref:Uncharacterized protein n=1 Tax=Candidatus Gottesmanbacteria bacterium RBG_16_52_11 TaxID=1798374 RepID=A0A1F5YMU2_9BACT|nr:MAG: hypothetical protein A2Z33_00535 [Candidatus Gottesmanbacteria bacterium RBG_16_52_11]